MFEYLRNGVLDSLGVFAGDDYLLAGSLFLVMFPVWVKGADLYYKCNDMVMGHFYMVFGITFAGLVGIGYIVLFFSHVIPGWTMDERFFGVIYLVGGAFLIPTLPSLMYMDKVNMVTWFLCTVWLINGGIYYFYYSTVLYVINIICCCLVQHCINTSEFCTRYFCQYCVVVNRRCHRIASFLRLVLTKISGTLFTGIYATLY